MSFKIQHGLFQFDFTDSHAILGVPLDAGADVIRKQYLKIARNLHPDRCKDKSDAEKQLASQLLSKLVNPAYEKLYPDKNLAESKLTLGRLGKRLAVEGGKAQLFTEAAKQLFQAGSNIDAAYKSQVQSLAASQYENFSQAVDVIAQISELNMVYLMRKQGELGSKTVGTKPPTEPPVEQKDQKPVEDKTPVLDPVQEIVESYCRRAEEYIAKNNFAKAILELREGLESSPNSSRCHGLLGTAYLYQKQVTMAKVHINKALQLNPKEESAQKAKEFLDKMAQKGTTATPNPGKTTTSKPDEKSGGTTIFGIKFGGKKK